MCFVFQLQSRYAVKIDGGSVAHKHKRWRIRDAGRAGVAVGSLEEASRVAQGFDLSDYSPDQRYVFGLVVVDEVGNGHARLAGCDYENCVDHFGGT